MKLKPLLIALTLAPILSAGAVAAPVKYAIDGDHAYPSFEADHFGGMSVWRGKFNKTSGTVVLDREAKTGAVDVTIDLSSVDTGLDKLNTHLKGADFFDTAKYPSLVFKSSNFRFKGEAVDEVAGELTMHGATKPVTLKAERFVCTAHPMRKTPVCAGDFSATIQRSDWGISTYSPNVGESVTLSIQVEALKK